jgi:hypothetical protein
MPLEPAEQAELALRIAGAIYLDPFSRPTSEQELTELKVRLNENEIAIERARSVADHDAMVKFIADEAEQRRASLYARNETAATKAAVQKVVEALQRLATTAAPDQDGDGPANGTCVCGLLPFAKAVEIHVVEAYAGAEAIHPVELSDEATRQTFSYRTFLTADINKRMGSFNVSGQTDINRIPTLVSLCLRRETSLTVRDIWQLVYVLHHELACHGFQYAAVLKSWDDHSMLPARENAPPSCHWTEGWMDAVALSLSREWARSSKSINCCGFGGKEAVRAMEDMHKERYPDPRASDPAKKFPAGVSPPDARLRWGAQLAFEMLATILSQSRTLADAEAIAVRFSLRLNAHERANPLVLCNLSARLQSTMLNEIRPSVAEAAALACVQFAEDGDLEELERALETADAGWRQTP